MKSLSSRLLLAAVALATSSAALAANPFVPAPTPAQGVKIKDVSKYTYELGVAQYRETYTETVDGAKFMKQSATMTGVQGSVTRHLTPDSQVKLSGLYASGESTYTGATWGGNYGDLRLSGMDRSLLTAELEYKLRSRDWNDVALSAGVGYRRLVDHLDQAGPGGYLRENERFYLTVGMERAFQAGDWIVTPQVKYKHSIKSAQTSHLFGHAIRNKQKSAHGLDLAVSISHQAAWAGMTITPYLRTWNVKDSELIPIGGGLALYEPQNKTREAGVTLAFLF